MGVVLAFKDAYSAQMGAFERKLAGLSARTTARGRTLGAAFLPVAKGVSLAGVATVAGLGLATKTAMDYSQKMAEVKTMMLDQLEYYPAVEKAVRETATAYGQSHEAAAEAAYFLLSAGVKASEVPLALASSAKEAVAGLAQLNTTADIGTTVINAYGWEAARLDDVFDKLQMTVVLGKTRLEELAHSAGRAYSIAAPLGVAFEQVNVAMAGVTKAGYSTEEAVTAVRALMLGVAQPTTDAGKALREVGGAAYEAAAGKRDLVGAIKALAVAPHAEERLRELFPNIRAMGAFGALGKQVDWMTGALGQMEGAAGTTQKALIVMTDEPHFKMQQLKSAAREAAISLGEALLPAAKGALGGLTPLAKSVGDFAKEHPGVTKTVAKISILAALSYPVLKLAAAFNLLTFAIAAAVAQGWAFDKVGGKITKWTGEILGQDWQKLGFFGATWAFAKDWDPLGVMGGGRKFGAAGVKRALVGSEKAGALSTGPRWWEKPAWTESLITPSAETGAGIGPGAAARAAAAATTAPRGGGGGGAGGGGGGGGGGLAGRGLGSRVFIVHFEQGSIVLQSNNPALKPLVKKALDDALTELEAEYAS